MMDGAMSAPSVQLPDHGCSISIDFLSFFFFSYVCTVANCWSRSITLHSPGRERAELAASVCSFESSLCKNHSQVHTLAYPP